jgi:hypothetical protein
MPAPVAVCSTPRCRSCPEVCASSLPQRTTARQNAREGDMGGQGGDTTLSPSRNPVLIRVLEKRKKRGDRVALFLATGGCSAAACVIHQHLSPSPPQGAERLRRRCSLRGTGPVPPCPSSPPCPPWRLLSPLLGHGRWQQVRVIASERPTCCLARNVAGTYDTASLDPALPIPAERSCWVQGPARVLAGLKTLAACRSNDYTRAAPSSPLPIPGGSGCWPGPRPGAITAASTARSDQQWTGNSSRCLRLVFLSRYGSS